MSVLYRSLECLHAILVEVVSHTLEYAELDDHRSDRTRPVVTPEAISASLLRLGLQRAERGSVSLHNEFLS